MNDGQACLRGGGGLAASSCIPTHGGCRWAKKNWQHRIIGSLDQNVLVPNVACTTRFWHILISGVQHNVLSLPFYLKSCPPRWYICLRPRNTLSEHVACIILGTKENSQLSFLSASVHPLLLSPPWNHPCLFSSLLHLYADGGRRGHCSECKWASCPSPPGHYVALPLLQLKRKFK